MHSPKSKKHGTPGKDITSSDPYDTVHHSPSAHHKSPKMHTHKKDKDVHATDRFHPNVHHNELDDTIADNVSPKHGHH
jgi:hypothetical protein